MGSVPEGPFPVPDVRLPEGAKTHLPVPSEQKATDLKDSIERGRRCRSRRDRHLPRPSRRRTLYTSCLILIS